MKSRNFQDMHIGAGIWLYLIGTTLVACADETLPVLKVGTEVYSNVTITAVTATDIYFTSAKGVANAKLKNLDPALQKHFKFDAASADAANTKQKAAGTSSSVSATSDSEPTIDRANAKAVMDDATARVNAIINQPVRQLARTPDMLVSVSSPGWFHAGAMKPDFATVDIRTTQDSQYDQRPYVTSDLNPGVVFVGSEIEFNPMTKFFYIDRSLPKKKLTEAEMLEINRLYRIIGACEEKLQPPSALVAGFLSVHKNAIILAALSLVLLLLPIRLFTSKRLG